MMKAWSKMNNNQYKKQFKILSEYFANSEKTELDYLQQK